LGYGKTYALSSDLERSSSGRGEMLGNSDDD
jgi:hypothetical protein